MRKSNKTKQALFTSVLSLMLCVSMLIGSTFAWFTDTTNTSVNKIQAGTLDIELLDADTENANSLEGKILSFAKADGAPEGEIVLFEPGAKYSLQQVWIHNAGNLHAKYQVKINGIDGSSKLAEVLDVYVGETRVGTLMELINSNEGIIKENTIAPEAYDTFGTIDLMMQTTAGNEYQGLTIEGVSIVVVATQDTVEYDSYENKYDEKASYPIPVFNQEELNTAIANATEPVVLSLAEGKYTITSKIGKKNITFIGSKNVQFDMTNFQWNKQLTQESTLTFENVTVHWSTNNTGYQGFTHSTKVTYNNCVINGTQFMYNDASFIDCTFKTENSYAVYGRGDGTLSFDNCTFNTGGRAIMLYSDGPTNVDVILTDCTFTDDGTYTSTEKAVVETGDNPNAPAKTSTFDITITNCHVTKGFETNNSTSNLWGNKDSMPKDRLNVVIDGVDVY